MRRAALGLGALILVLAVIVVVRALLVGSRQLEVTRAPPLGRPVVEMAPRLARALTFRTVSADDAAAPAEVFAELHRHLEDSFPAVHRQLERERIGGSSLLYRWQGSDRTLAPIVLLAHQDVVPPGDEARWKRPPFGGVIADGYIWGRGALDDKVSVVGLLEAVHILVQQGHAPRRTVYLAFGHDEEIGGAAGAAAIARTLGERGVRPLLVLDEGLAITEGIIEGMDRPVALVGLAEKGHMSLELVASAAGGHSSMPPRETAVARIARAVSAIETSRMPASIDPPVSDMFDFLAPEMPFGPRLAVANTWLFGPLLRRTLTARPATNAAVRTTTAPTIIQGGIKENVLPTTARAVINARIKPGDSVAAVLDHARSVIDDDQVQVRVMSGAAEPSGVSPADGAAFELIHRSIREVDPRIVVAPGLVLGATDARHYARLTRAVYRFQPVRFGPEDLARVHGIDERVSIADYGTLVAFYVRLMKNADALREGEANAGASAD